MSCLLTIDTSLEIASVSVLSDGELVGVEINNSQKDHAAWLQPAIESMFSNTGILLSELDAIGVVAGPGSYTGLRVGMASAKGLCYALKKPLITLNGLYMMASAFQSLYVETGFICPMVDARRMEVFTALYGAELNQLLEPQAIILEESSFDSWLIEQPVYFIGNGAQKYKILLKSPNAIFPEWRISPGDIARITQEIYHRDGFADLAYAEPMYIKAFYHPAKANS
jgi:tRNA threonylcarbamoyladenosine biosynthesis protein TsaB